VKTYIKTIAVIFIVAAALPLISLFFVNKNTPSAVTQPPQQTQPDKPAASETAAFTVYGETAEYSGEAGIAGVAGISGEAGGALSNVTVYAGDFGEIKLYDITAGEVVTLPLEDYVTGAVLQEMHYTFEAEALKAQAVAARTYAVRKILENREKPRSDIAGADVSNDFTVFQGYYSEETAREIYKEKYDTAMTKISSAVSDTKGLIVVSEDEPIVAAFHSMSSGMTEYSGNIWQTQLPYLVPVLSAEDTETVPLETVYSFTETEVRARLTTEIDGINLPISPANWFEIEKVSESGTVLIMKAGDRLISGEDFRDIFSLRSAVFECEYNASEGAFRIVTKGYGHGVGMSQYGANGMAKEGYTWDQILLHYYSGAEIAVLSET
jgi:stage II sporulation protein D